MAAAKAPQQRAPHRRWPVAEKRRIVELTLHAGVSVHAVAREHGVHPTSLSCWRALYRAGKLDAQSTPRVRDAIASATLVPVSIVPGVCEPQAARPADAGACGRSVVQLTLPSGATLRIETGALDASWMCALVAELRR